MSAVPTSNPPKTWDPADQEIIDTLFETACRIEEAGEACPPDIRAMLPRLQRVAHGLADQLC